MHSLHHSKTKMTNILQANLHRSLTADALLVQVMMEHKADLAVISEQYSPKNGNWYEDTSKTAAIWIINAANFQILRDGKGDGFVWVSSNTYTVISCYLTPNCCIEDFQSKLDSIEDTARSIGGNLIIAGDFNARAIEWGTTTTNSRGRRILDMVARLGLMIANTGTSTTFRRAGCMGSIPDITLVSERFFERINHWKVLEDYTGSDHQYLSYRVQSDRNRTRGNTRSSTKKWNVSRLRTDILLAKIDESQINWQEPIDAESYVNEVMTTISEACNAAMPRISAAERKKAAYWWTEEIGQLRRLCHQCRRRYTRARRLGQAIVEAEEFKTARKYLKIAIIESKRSKWEELRSNVNEDPWGLGYKLVIKKLGPRANTPNLTMDQMHNIVKELFPEHGVYDPENIHMNGDELATLFSTEELLNAANSIKNRKAPGPDGIPAEVLKILARERPHFLLTMYNACLMDGIFPEPWKIQKLVLISKGKGDPEHPSSYRPLCMLDTAGKLLEKLIKPRLARAIEGAGGLSNRQYGFRPGRSTLGALDEVVQSVYAAQTGNHHSRRIVLIVTLDVKNAFNSARWRDILKALEIRFKIPTYLKRLVRSYLQNRVLIYDTISGPHRKQITAGAAQGSVLGPELWNAMYDEILTITMPADSYLVGYADDIAGVIVARDTNEAQRKLNQIMIRTQTWMSDHGLRLATEKTELIILTRKHMPTEIPMVTQFGVFETKKIMKYLGIRLDSKLSFWPQIQHATKKAAERVSLLSRLMANTGGPTACKRKILMATSQATLLYACEIWGEAIESKHRRNVLSSIQRTTALRVASAYRTVSEAAVMVISGTIPIDLLIRERRIKWKQRNQQENRLSAKEIRQHSLEAWQQRWQNEIYGRWTAQLIPILQTWINRTYGDVNYYLTQILSGHGYFCKYLHKMGKASGPECIYGDSSEDDAKHTVFECIKWQEQRIELEQHTGPLTTENIIQTMTAHEHNWNLISRYIEQILRRKKKDLDSYL